MTKLVIFDMDGLMFDTERLTCQSYLEVVKGHGFEATKEMYLMQLGLNMDDICKQYIEHFGNGIDPKALYKEVGIHKYEIIDRDGLPVKDGLYALMNDLDQRGIKMAVASSSDRKNIFKNLAMAGIENRFACILSAKDSDIKRGKPFPDIFLKVCEILNIPPEEALVLEDSMNGICASLAGNIPVIAVPDLLPISGEVAGACLAVVESLNDVIDYIL